MVIFLSQIVNTLLYHHWHTVLYRKCIQQLFTAVGLDSLQDNTQYMSDGLRIPTLYIYIYIFKLLEKHSISMQRLPELLN